MINRKLARKFRLAALGDDAVLLTDLHSVGITNAREDSWSGFCSDIYCQLSKKSHPLSSLYLTSETEVLAARPIIDFLSGRRVETKNEYQKYFRKINATLSRLAPGSTEYEKCYARFQRECLSPKRLGGLK